MGSAGFECHLNVWFGGIEARQRSTPPFIDAIQRECIGRLADTRSPEAVLTRVASAIATLQDGRVPTEELIIRKPVSKPPDGYSQTTQTVAALQRAAEQDLSIHPGQDVEYVVVDDVKSSRERVALTHEAVATYDADYYETQLIRAVESVLSPLGWDEKAIEEQLAETTEHSLQSFVERQ